MPSLSPTMTDGSIVQWSKKEGDEVAAGDVLCEVQTDKAVVALETDEDGTLAKILVPADVPNIKVGHFIAVLASPGEDWKQVAASVEVASETSAEAALPVSETPEGHAVGAPIPASLPITHPGMGPAARLLVQKHRLDASKIPATGPHGQLLKSDVLAFAEKLTIDGHPCQAASATPATPAPTPLAGAAPLVTQTNYTDIPLTSMRKTIAKRLSHSKSSIPHTYVRGVAWLDQVNQLRKEIKASTGIKLSVNDFVMKACASALRMVPEMNALADETTGAIRMVPTVDICMAVATPSGLITPILGNVDRTPITDLAASAVAMAKKARDGKLQPHEFQGGNFTISNLGMFGIREFTAIINPPQVAILAVGTGIVKAIPSVTDTNQVNFGTRMTLTLSIDSRYVDATVAGRFLSHVSELLTKHPNMLLSGDPRLTKCATRDGVLPTDEFDLAMISVSAGLPQPQPIQVN